MEFLYPTLPYEDKVRILVFLVETASGTSAIRYGGIFRNMASAIDIFLTATLLNKIELTWSNAVSN